MSHPRLDLFRDACPRCQSADVLQFRALRTSAEYLCDCCGHQWEVAGSVVDAAGETTTVRVTVSTGFGADRHRLTIN